MTAPTYFGWFDSSTDSQQEKLERAIRAFAERRNATATLVLVHPTSIAEMSAPEGVEVRPDRHVPVNTFHVAHEEIPSLTPDSGELRICEQCGMQQGDRVAWDRYGDPHVYNSLDSMNASYGEHLFGEFPDCTTVRITIAERSDGTLAALCQHCWPLVDSVATDRRRAKKRRDREIRRGQLTFLAEVA